MSENSDPYTLRVHDMTCAACVRRVEQAITAVDGVESGTVNLIEKQAEVIGGDPQQVVEAIRQRGYDAALVTQEEGEIFFYLFRRTVREKKRSFKSSLSTTQK